MTGVAMKIASQAVGLRLPRQNRRDLRPRARDLLHSAADARAPQVDMGLGNLVRDLCLREPSHPCKTLAAVALTTLPTGPPDSGSMAWARAARGDRLMDKRDGSSSASRPSWWRSALLVPVANRRDPRFGRAAPTRAAARPFKRGGVPVCPPGQAGEGKAWSLGQHGHDAW
jgi:hypothetical protein